MNFALLQHIVMCVFCYSILLITVFTKQILQQALVLVHATPAWHENAISIPILTGGGMWGPKYQYLQYWYLGPHDFVTILFHEGDMGHLAAISNVSFASLCASHFKPRPSYRWITTALHDNSQQKIGLQYLWLVTNIVMNSLVLLGSFNTGVTTWNRRGRVWSYETDH